MLKKHIIENASVVNEEIKVPEMNLKTKNKTFRNIGPKKLASIIIILIALFGIYGSLHYYNKYKALTTDPNIEAKKETDRLVSILGKIIELPKDETPTVATISDKDKLKEQTFFTQAENGDILFAYTTSMKAILYRPSTNKIINVAPININQSPDLTSSTTKAPANTMPPMKK